MMPRLRLRRIPRITQVPRRPLTQIDRTASAQIITIRQTTRHLIQRRKLILVHDRIVVQRTARQAATRYRPTDAAGDSFEQFFSAVVLAELVVLGGRDVVFDSVAACVDLLYVSRLEVEVV